MSKIDVQVIYALQRAQSSLEDEARVLHEAHDYSAEFPANDAELIGKAIDLLRNHPQPNAGVVTDISKYVAELHFWRNVAATSREWDRGSAIDILGAILDRLDSELSAAPAPPCTIVHSEDPSAPEYLALGAVKVTREMCG